MSLSRMGSLGSSSNPYVQPPGGYPLSNWTDSLPRRDLYNNIAPTGSLPRRDKAGLGRPEPPSAKVPPGPPPRRRESSLTRDYGGIGANSVNPYAVKDKRNSTGNLYFTDTMQDPLTGLSNTLQVGGKNGRLSGSQPVDRNDSSCTSLTSIESTGTLGSNNEFSVSRELRTAAGIYFNANLPFPGIHFQSSQSNEDILENTLVVLSIGVVASILVEPALTGVCMAINLLGVSWHSTECMHEARGM